MKHFLKNLNQSPINYFSDLFIIAMVVMWIVDNIYESLIATIVTFSSILLSFTTGAPCFDTNMWSSIGSNVVVPLAAGGALWMIKNGVQHAIMNNKNKECPSDFPKVDVEDMEIEEEYLEDEFDVTDADID